MECVIQCGWANVLSIYLKCVRTCLSECVWVCLLIYTHVHTMQIIVWSVRETTIWWYVIHGSVCVFAQIYTVIEFYWNKHTNTIAFTSVFKLMSLKVHSRGLRLGSLGSNEYWGHCSNSISIEGLINNFFLLNNFSIKIKSSYATTWLTKRVGKWGKHANRSIRSGFICTHIHALTHKRLVRWQRKYTWSTAEFLCTVTLKLCQRAMVQIQSSNKITYDCSSTKNKTQ